MTFEEAFIDEMEKEAGLRHNVASFLLERLGRGLRRGHLRSARGLRSLLQEGLRWSPAFLKRKAERDVQYLEHPGLMELAAKGIRGGRKKEEKAELRKLNIGYQRLAEKMKAKEPHAGHVLA